MNTEQLLTAPASTLTRKQRRDRAALKREVVEMARKGRIIGRDSGAGEIRVVEPGTAPRPGHVIVTYPDARQVAPVDIAGEFDAPFPSR
jgi:hypothetical protein